LAQLRIFHGLDALSQLGWQGRPRGRAALCARGRGALDLLPHAEAHRGDAKVERLEALQQFVREQRQLLRPRRRSHVDGQDSARQRARLGAARHAVSQQAPPGVAVDRDLAALGRDDARAVEQLSEHLRARARLHPSRGALRPRRVNRSMLIAPPVTMRITKAARAALWLGAFCGSVAGCRLRAISTPLGGKHEEEAPVVKAAASAAPAPVASSAPVAEDEQGAEQAEEVEVATAPAAAPAASGSAAPPSKAPPGAFAVKPYVAHQAWTRLFDLEFALKVGPGGGIEMKMVSHQEARFEVLSVAGGSIEKLQIEYNVYKSTMTIMGNTQDTPEELAGKRFVISFAQGKPQVRDASGGTPPKKQIDSVKDDAREPLEIEKALKELAQLAAKGQGDFSHAGAIAFAGGEDEDTKVTRATARLQRVNTSGKDKLALLDLGYTVTNQVDEKNSIEAQVTGTLNVLDGPARYQTSTLQGPMELRSSEAGGMQGRGTVRITTSYKY
jgi:hypothetical protein